MSFLIDISSRLNSFTLQISLDSGKMKPGQIIGLLGPSGSGKTMTLRSIAGIAKPDSGKIIVNGCTFFDSEEKINRKPQARRVGFLFQNYALFPNMTVSQNIECGLAGARMQKKYTSSALRKTGRRTFAKEDRGEREEKIREVIRRMHLEGLENRKPSELSGGQQQRTALARILVGNPQIVLLDEPFSALDEYLRDQLLDETMDQLTGLGITVFFVTHSRIEARKVCSDIAIISQGRICEMGKTEDVFTNPSSEWGKILTGADRRGCFRDFVQFHS